MSCGGLRSDVPGQGSARDFRAPAEMLTGYEDLCQLSKLPDQNLYQLIIMYHGWVISSVNLKYYVYTLACFKLAFSVTDAGNIEEAINKGFLSVDEDMLKGMFNIAMVDHCKECANLILCFILSGHSYIILNDPYLGPLAIFPLETYLKPIMPGVCADFLMVR